MTKIKLDTFKKDVLLAAITGYCQGGAIPRIAIDNSLGIVRELENNIEWSGEEYTITSLSPFDELEKKIGGRVQNAKKDDVKLALYEGVSVEKIIELNPDLLKK